MKFSREKLKEARKARNMKQTELAAAIGCNQPAVSNWEKGRQRPGMVSVMKLADVFGVDPRFFFTGK